MKITNLVRWILPHILLWGILAVSFFLPDLQADKIDTKTPMMVVFVGASVLLAGLAVVAALKKIQPKRVLPIYDLTSVFAAIMLLWEVLANKASVLDAWVFTSPARVFAVFPGKWSILLSSIQSSMSILVPGFFIGVIAGIGAGLICGWFKNIYNVAYPLSKIIAPIPPPVYIPFFLMIFPEVRQSAIAIIAIGTFWPVFATTCFATYTIDRRYIEAAQMLGAKDADLLRRVVFPGVLPEIFSGVFIGMILAFILLIVAEMVGASSGLGYFLLTQRLLSRYAEVIAGIFTTGLVVVVWAEVFDLIEKRALRWKMLA